MGGRGWAGSSWHVEQTQGNAARALQQEVWIPDLQVGKRDSRAPVSVPITDRPRQQMGKEQFPRHQLTNTKVVGKGKSPSPPLPCISLTPVRYPLQWIKSKSIAKFKNTFNADLFISRRVCTIDSFPLQKLFKPARFLFILLYLNI